MKKIKVSIDYPIQEDVAHRYSLVSQFNPNHKFIEWQEQKHKTKLLGVIYIFLICALFGSVVVFWLLQDEAAQKISTGLLIATPLAVITGICLITGINLFSLWRTQKPPLEKMKQFAAAYHRFLVATGLGDRQVSELDLGAIIAHCDKILERERLKVISVKSQKARMRKIKEFASVYEAIASMGLVRKSMGSYFEIKKSEPNIRLVSEPAA